MSRKYYGKRIIYDDEYDDPEYDEHGEYYCVSFNGHGGNDTLCGSEHQSMRNIKTDYGEITCPACIAAIEFILDNIKVKDM